MRLIGLIFALTVNAYAADAVATYENYIQYTSDVARRTIRNLQQQAYIDEIEPHNLLATSEKKPVKNTKEICHKITLKNITAAKAQFFFTIDLKSGICGLEMRGDTTPAFSKRTITLGLTDIEQFPETYFYEWFLEEKNAEFIEITAHPEAPLRIEIDNCKGEWVVYGIPEERVRQVFKWTDSEEFRLSIIP